MARTKQSARKSTGGKAPRKVLATLAAPKSFIDEEDTKGVWRHPSKGEPYFPKNYEIIRRDILQVTNFDRNNNKYYSLELHQALEKTEHPFRIFTHYGRSDDLETNPNSGRKECRYFLSFSDAHSMYNSLMTQKQSARKGYKKVDLVSAKIGSELAKQQALLTTPGTATSASKLPQEIQTLVHYIFSEASNTLTSSIAANITYKGIETPLGILSLQQVERGEAILQDILTLLQSSKNPDEERLLKLSSDFYSAIPHRIGRSRDEIKNAVLRTLTDIEKKQDLLQLMKDMISVTQEGTVFTNEIDLKYKGLKCQLRYLDHASQEYQEIERHVLQSCLLNDNYSGKSYNKVVVRNIYGIKRDVEFQSFNQSIHNQQLLFHGSRISNFVGLLSRGLLMPKVIVGLGGQRTSSGTVNGWLGSGLYFGNSASTSAIYTTKGDRGTRMMLLCRVALGNVKDYFKITTDLETAPSGHHSVHGVKKSPFNDSDFTEDEFVVYSPNQQRQEYLIEFTSDNEQVNENYRYVDAFKDSKGSNNNNTFATNYEEDENDEEEDYNEEDEEEEEEDYDQDDYDQEEKEVEEEDFDDEEHDDEEEHDEEDDEEEKPKKWAKKESVFPKPSAKKKEAKKEPTKKEKALFYNEDDEQLEEEEEDDDDDTPAPSISDEYLSYLKELYAKHKTPSSHQDNNQIKSHETHFRELYATQRNSHELEDPFVNLIDVYQNYDNFVFQPENEEESASCKLLSSHRLQKQGHSVVSESAFYRNWSKLTNNIFDGMDWSNVCVAGGSVIAAMLAEKGDIEEGAFKSSDIDLFLWGITDQQQANEKDKLKSIYNSLLQHNPSMAIIRTRYAVTFLNEFPFRNIQIVLRLYKSPAEVLMGFDIDSCTAAFDGYRAWCLPRTKRSLNKQYNLVAMDRRSLTYEARLFKYSKRRFAAAVPNFERTQVDPQLFTKTLKQVQGLGKLLLLEYRQLYGSKKLPVAMQEVENEEEAFFGKKHRKAARRRRQRQRRQKKPKENLKQTINKLREMEKEGLDDEDLDLEIEGAPSTSDDEGVLDESDYTDVHIPWGPGWFSNKVVGMLSKQDKARFFNREGRQRIAHRHLFVSGIDGVLQGKAFWCKFCRGKFKEDPKDAAPPSEVDVSGPLSWVVENPGKQLLTGSFHPVTDDKWYQQAILADQQKIYLAALCDASFRGDYRQMQETMSKISSNISMTSSVKSVINDHDIFGKTPLSYCCSFGHSQCAEMLLSNGADPTLKEKNSLGMSPLHLAVFSNNSKLLRLLLSRAQGTSGINTRNGSGMTPLHIACYYNYPECADILIEQGANLQSADKNGRYPLHYCALGNSVDTMQALLSCNLTLAVMLDKNGESALQLAINKGQTAFIEAFGAATKTKVKGLSPKQSKELPSKKFHYDVDAYSLPLLHAIAKAASMTNTSRVADDVRSKIKPSLINKSDSNGVAPLHLAVCSDQHPTILQHLLNQAGIQVDQKDKFGQTPLHYAVKHFNLPAVEALLKKGANPNQSNVVDQTPLYYLQLLSAVYWQFDNSDLLNILPTPEVKHQIDGIRNVLTDHRGVISKLSPYPLLNINMGFKLSWMGILSAPLVDEEDEDALEQNTFPVIASPARGGRRRSPPQSPMKSHPPERNIELSIAQFGPQPGAVLQEPTSVDAFGPQPGYFLSHPDALERPSESGPPNYKNALSKCLILISMLHKGGQLTLSEKESLKSMTLDQNPLLVAAVECYNVDDDLAEFASTLKSILSKANKAPSVSFQLSEPTDPFFSFQQTTTSSPFFQHTFNDNNEQEFIEEKKSKTQSAAATISGNYGLIWSEVDTMLILDSHEINARSKIAGFDMDDTLITTSSGSKFSTSRTDWKWLYPEVPAKLKELNRQGYKVVIFTNQAGIESGKQSSIEIQHKILDLSNQLGFPLQAFVACASDSYRKPHTTMWDYMVKYHNSGVQPDKINCVFVGDAAGRTAGWKPGARKDFSCADRCFANNVGVPFKTPEEFFLGYPECTSWAYEGIDPKVYLERAQKSLGARNLIKRDGQEMVILVGMPASGKSTFAKKFVQEGGYSHINRDTLKSKEQCFAVCRDALSQGRSVVIDNTNPSASIRKEYTSIADTFGVPYRCFVFNTDPELAHHLNLYREVVQGVRRIPDIAYNAFQKTFQAPTTSEGFTQVQTIDWVPDFPTEELKQVFLQRMS